LFRGGQLILFKNDEFNTRFELCMEKIKSKLAELAHERKIEILFACETGSRAWGFPSPDSDYDIRFIYVHPLDWYLSLGHRKDTVELPISEELDITGWDLRKSLLMLKKSNAALIERFQSPIEYYSKPGFKNEFKALIDEYYSPTAVFYHHLSLAGKFRDEVMSSDKVKLKTYFYFLRSLLSCNWIVHHKNVLPMHLEGLMEIISKDWQEEIRALVALKSGVKEKHLVPIGSLPFKRDEQVWKFVMDSKDNLGVAKNDFKQLDSFFRKTLTRNADT
jgi:uncharacterized protein